MRDARRSKADLIAELDSLRARVAELSAGAEATASNRADLHRLETRYQHALQNAGAMIAEIDEKGAVTYVSPTVHQLLGYLPEEILRRPGFDWVHEEDRPAIEELYGKHLASGGSARITYRSRHRAGHWVWLETTGTTHRARDGSTRSIAFTRDISELKRADGALRESEARFRLLAEATHDVVLELDSEGQVVYRSPNSVALLGEPSRRMLGRTPFERLHPDDAERGVELFLGHLKTPGPLEGAELRVRHEDGSYRLIECGGVNYENANGDNRIVLVARDITESRRLREERSALEQRMQQIQKLESLGVLAGGIAHDFNNLLTPILGDASLGLMELDPESPLRTRFEKIKTAAQRAAVLTGQMLAYAGTESLRIELLDLSQVVREMSRLLETAASRKAILEYDLADDLPSIEGDTAQISQVAMNLIGNASEALEDKTGRIAIRTGAVDADSAYLARTFPGNALRKGTYVYLEVADTGCGIDAEAHERIFDPFFSTKFMGRGLGLAAVLGIVHGHGGTIELESEPGRGTRLRSLFPSASRGPGPS